MILWGPAVLGDLGALVAIDQDSSQPWTEGAFRSELGNDPPTAFVLRSNREVIAFVVIRREGPDLDIVNLAVARSQRRNGHGRQLVGSLLEQASAWGVRRVFLEVREGNGAARKLYEGLGFKETQRRRGFYSGPPEDAILMSVQI